MHRFGGSSLALQLVLAVALGVLQQERLRPAAATVATPPRRDHRDSNGTTPTTTHRDDNV